MGRMEEDFIRLIKDTVIILGGKDDILTLIDNYKNENSLEELKKWNDSKLNELQDRFSRFKKN